MTDVLAGGSRPAHSTVAGSSFPPIADYGFISDCEVSALIAPSGNVEWLCLPRMDGPSVFAAILDRDAGRFRLGPADVTVPAGRRYLPGTMVLETTWDTPTGWAVVRDVLLIGPWRHDDQRSDTHPRVPTDHAAERVLLRTVRCFIGSIDFVLECEPAFDYGRKRGEWRHTADGYGDAEVSADDTGPVLRLRTDLNVGFEGPRAIARRRLRAGEEVFCALSWDDGSAAGDVYGGSRAAGRNRRLLARVAEPRSVSGSSLAHLPAAVGADPQGAHLCAERSAAGGLDDLATRDARRGAQLRLPLQLVARLDVHAVGPLHAGL